MKCDVCGSKEVTSVGQYDTCIVHSHMIRDYKDTRDKSHRLYSELKDLFLAKGLPR